MRRVPFLVAVAVVVLGAASVGSGVALDTPLLIDLCASTTVTATGSCTEAFEVPTPVIVLSRDEIERLAPSSATDLLRYQPGVDVNGVGPNQTRPVIRGHRGLRVLILQDGLRMNNPRRQADFGELPGLVDTESLESVEVVRGPAAVLYGSDAIGGVLNLIPRTPGNRDAGGLAGSFSVSGRSSGDQVKGQSSLERRWSRTSMQLGLSARDASDYEAPGGTFGDISLSGETVVLDSGAREESVYGYLGQELSDGHELHFRFQRYNAEQAGFGLVEPEALGSEQSSRIRILYPLQEFDRLTAGYTASALELAAADSLDVKAYYQANERRLVNDTDIDLGSLFRGAPSSTIEVDTVNFTEVETFGLRAQVVKSAGERHLLTYGGELYKDDSRNTDSSVRTTTIWRLVEPIVWVHVATDDVANAPNATNESLGFFVQDEIEVGDRFKLWIGGRWQNVATRAEPTPGWEITGLDFDDDNLVGSLGWVYSLSDNQRLVVSYGAAFRAPNIVERLFNGPTPEGAGFLVLNPDLTSEESDNIEFGWKYCRSNALFELLLFRSEIDNGIIQFFLSPEEVAQLPAEVQNAIADDQARFVVQQRNADQLRWEGVELVLDYRAENGFGVGANYTNIDGERIDSDIRPMGDTASERLNLRLRWAPPRGIYWGEYRLRYNGSQQTVLDADEPIPPVGEVLPSFTVHSLSAGLTLPTAGRPSHVFTLLVDNITDELYAEFPNATFFRPQPERSVTLSYQVRF